MGLVVLDAPQLARQAPSPQPGEEVCLVPTVIEDRLPRPAAEVVEVAKARGGIPGESVRQPGGAPGQASQDQSRFVVAGEKRVGDRIDLLGAEILESQRRLQAPVREARLLLFPGQPLLRQGEGQDSVAQDGDGAFLVEG